MSGEDINTDEQLTQEQLIILANQNRNNNKKIITFSGLNLSIMAIAIFVVQIIIAYLSKTYFKEFYESNWYNITVTAIGVAGVGLPVFAILMKRIPDSERGEVKRLSFGKFLKCFFISVAAMYLANFITVFINFFIGIMRGNMIENPVKDIVYNSNMILNILYVSIFGPLVEELIFRKILLDKLRRFGDLPAILLTGIAFGLFHMNLSQFLYATVLGILFAYITIRSNTVFYTVILHMMINFMGSALPMLVIDESIISMGIFALWVYGSMTIGIVLFILNVKKIKLNKPRVALVKTRDFILNPGTLIFISICLVMIVISLL